MSESLRTAAHPPPLSAHQQLLLRSFAGRKFQKYYWDFRYIVPLDAVCLLSFLCDRAQRAAELKKDKFNGWVRCSREWLGKKFLFTDKQQRRLFEILKKGGFLHVRMINDPAKRHVYVDVERIHEEIESAKKRPSVQVNRCPKGRGSEGCLKGHGSLKRQIRLNNENPPPQAERGIAPEETKSSPGENSHKVEKMPLLDINDGQPERKSVSSPKAIELAKSHREFCKSKKWWISQSKTKWGKQFQIIINQIGEKETEKLLIWYHQNQGKLVKLELRNGKEFKDQLGIVQGIYDRHIKDNPNLTVSEDAKKVCQKLAGFHWPKGGSEVEQAVQLSLNTYNDFLRRCSEVMKQPFEIRRKVKLRNKRTGKIRIIERITPIPEAPSKVLSVVRFDSDMVFVENWFRRMNDKAHYFVKEHGDWTSGPLKSAFTSLDHRDFLAYVEGKIHSNFSSEYPVNKFMEAIRNV